MPIRRVAVLGALVVLAGCTTRLVDFTMISTKNIDLSQAASFQRGPTRVEGIDKVHIIVFIPTGVPNMKEAIDRAIESVPGAVALVDGVLSQRWWYIPYVYGQSFYVVEGTPLIVPAAASQSRTGGQYVIATVDDGGEVSSRSAVPAEAFRAIKRSLRNEPAH